MERIEPPKSAFRGLRRLWHKALGSRAVEIDGVRLCCDARVVAARVRSLAYRGDYESAERQLLPRAITAGDAVLEIGAGVGLISILCNRLAYPGHVVSYEANPRLAAIIQQNFALNGMTGDVRMKAVSRDGAALRFFVDENIISSSVHRRGDMMVEMEVESVSIASCIAEHRPTVLIMDVEGAETTLLRSADLSGVKSILVEMHPHIVGQAEIDSLVRHLENSRFELTAVSSLNYLFQSKGR